MWLISLGSWIVNLNKIAFEAAIGGCILIVFAGWAVAEARQEVLDRISPVGQVVVVGATASVVPVPKAEESAVEQPKSEEKVASGTPAAAPTPEKSGSANGKSIYSKSCIACHLAGVAGAPKLGNKDAWAPRIAKGMDALLKSAVNGVTGTAMPPRGTCADCTDEDLRSAIEFMVSKSQ